MVLNAPGLVDSRSRLGKSGMIRRGIVRLARGDRLDHLRRCPSDLIICVNARLRTCPRASDRRARGKAADQDEMRNPVGVRRGKQRAHRAALGEAHHGRTRRTDRIHDGAHIIHALLERWRPSHAIGKPLAPLVEGHDPGEAREPAQEGRVSGQFMHELDMRNDAGDKDDVDGPVANHLIGDVDVAAQRIACLGQRKIVHCRQSQVYAGYCPC